MAADAERDLRVVAAMSGGVDSSVAAALLKKRGFDVVGIGLQLFDPAGEGGAQGPCLGSGAMDDAGKVAETLNIPFHVLDFTELFRDSVIDYFVRSYLRGETPNPCVPCNRVVKFEHLLAAADRLGAAYLATGHYVRATRDPASARMCLKKGADPSKDQSYFLYSLSQHQLARALFPIGEMTKEETRRLAGQLGLEVHDKPESQDVCFIGEEGHAAFVSRHARDVAGPGPILDERGAVLGTHRGIHTCTIGQRHGLGLTLPEAMYVVDIDPAGNSITVAPRRDLRRQERVLLGDVNYVSVEPPTGPLEVEAVTRYRKPAAPARLLPIDDLRAYVEFRYPDEPTAPGQSVVLYRGEDVVGGGIVRRADDR